MPKRIKHDLQQLVNFALENVKALSVSDAEISCSLENGLSVDVRSGDVETLTHHLDQQFSITIYDECKTGTASSTDLSENAIRQTIEKAATIAKFASADPYAGLPSQEGLAFDYPDCQLSSDWDISAQDMIALAIEAEKIGCAHQRIKNSEGVSISTFKSDAILANTLGFMGRYPVTQHGITCSFLAKENGQMQRDYDYTVARDPSQLRSHIDVAKGAADRTARRLNARPIKTQTCPVIFEAPVARSLLRAFVSAISGGNLYRQSSFLLNALNQSVFPEFINIYQQPHLLGAIGSRPFDSEGVKTKEQFYVENGMLSSYVLGSYSARKLGMSSTGNAGGVFNLAITQSDITLPALLKEMGTGLFVTEMMGQGVNVTTGDYSRGAAGFWVENGEIQFPVEEITVAGNLKQMFQSIRAIANDTDYRSSIRTGSILIDKMTIAGE